MYVTINQTPGSSIFKEHSAPMSYLGTNDVRIALWYIYDVVDNWLPVNAWETIGAVVHIVGNAKMNVEMAQRSALTKY